MALARSRRTASRVDYWPGFVDALSTLLLAIMFLLSVFVLGQFFLSQEISGKDTALNRLNDQINELTQLLSLERGQSQDLEDQLRAITANLATAETERTRLQAILDAGAGAGEAAEARAGELAGELDEERRVSQRAQAQIQTLNQQLASLRQQLAAIEGALELSESKERESRTQIVDLGRRLNVALAARVQELNRYRSDFFGRLREIVGNREDIRIVGDRFVFQSEVLFPPGGARLNPAGLEQMSDLARALIEVGREIPDEINWVLRVDGHTDNVPLTGTGRYRDNWELSQARALSVVKYLISQGIPPDRLVAAGFGENQPLDPAGTPAARAKNRRIELKLTER